MVTVALILSVVVGMQWRMLRARRRELREAWAAYARLTKSVEGFLSRLERAGGVARVDTCQRTQGSKR